MDKFTINKLKIENMLGNLDERETTDVDNLASNIANDSYRDLLLTSISLVLIVLLIISSLAARFCSARMREPPRENRRSKAKAKCKSQEPETDEDGQEP